MAERRDGEPKAATMRVKLKYPDVETFLAKYGPNISRGGIFIATKTPRPIGTAIRFDFQLVQEGSEASVLRGEGTVHFVREADPSVPSRAPGMGVRFTQLFDDGQALVDRALRMRGAQQEPPSSPDLPRGVREVTGEFEIGTGPHALVNPTTDVDELARASGVSAAELDAVLGRRGSRGIDLEGSAAELEALLQPSEPTPTSAPEAAQRLEALLSRRRRRQP